MNRIEAYYLGSSKIHKMSFPVCNTLIRTVKSKLEELPEYHLEAKFYRTLITDLDTHLKILSSEIVRASDGGGGRYEPKLLKYHWFEVLVHNLLKLVYIKSSTFNIDEDLEAYKQWRK